MDANNSPGENTESESTVAENILQTLRDNGVEYLFANLGSDHPAFLEAEARIQKKDDQSSIPELIICPHEFAAMSAAHGYAAVTGQPQAVLVHVDVGTQNLGAAVHNAYRAKQPVFIIAGLAPLTDNGYNGSRDHPVHYLQDTFDQEGILREYCRWTYEYRLPANPDTLVTRGLERATASPQGPVYLSVAREATESTEFSRNKSSKDIINEESIAPADSIVDELIASLTESDYPLIITSYLGDKTTNELTEIAEKAGAGIIEHRPSVRSFPRDHNLHLGFTPSEVLDKADLILSIGSDIPWVPSNGGPTENTKVIQIDLDPSKEDYPYWDFPIDQKILASPTQVVKNIASSIESKPNIDKKEQWEVINRERQKSLDKQLSRHREADRLTPAVVSDEVNNIVDEETIVMEDAVTSSSSVLDYIHGASGIYSKGGSGLGWAPGAAIGAKLAHPDKRVISLVGDGAYVFANPTACSWIEAAHSAPTLTIIYNNHGWNAVKSATTEVHPEGVANESEVARSKFDPPFDLSKPAETVLSYTNTVSDFTELSDTLDEAVEKVDSGKPAVINVEIEPM